MKIHDIQYLILLNKILYEGNIIEQRAVLKDGTLPKCYSLFGEQLKFKNLDKYFPLFTHKNVYWKGVVHELLWFFRGETSIKYLKDNNVHIWDEWALNDNLGPYVYPNMWKFYPNIQGQPYVNQLNLIQNQIEEIKKNPNASCGRRIILTAWHPTLHPSKAPPACHTLCQFKVYGDTLHCHMYQRSADYVLGVPFNIASYALFTKLLATSHGLKAGDLTISFGDVHIYENHLEWVNEIKDLEDLDLPSSPTVNILNKKSNLCEYVIEDIELSNYNPLKTNKKLEVAV